MSGDSLSEQPYSYSATQAGRVRIFRGSRLAITLTGNKASKFLMRVEGADANTAQLLMAKATGQFKFGNER